MAEVVKVPEFRASYAYVFDARKNDLNGKMEFTIDMVWPKSTDLSAVKAAIKAVAKEKWGDKMPENLRSPLKSQDAKADKEPYEVGGFYITAKSEQKPGVVGTKVDSLTGKLTPLDQTEFFSGCYAVATVHFFAYDQKGNRGVSATLHNIQMTREGPSLGNRTRPEDDFEPVDAAAGGESAGGTAASIFD